MTTVVLGKDDAKITLTGDARSLAIEAPEGFADLLKGMYKSWQDGQQARPSVMSRSLDHPTDFAAYLLTVFDGWKQESTDYKPPKLGKGKEASL